jgi:anti-sigma B factor antagonist
MSSLVINQRQVNAITVLDCAGRISLGEGSTLLREALQQQMQQPSPRVLLNLAEVAYIDSSGLGELVSAYVAMHRQAGELKLLHLTRKVHDLLQITKLYTVFEVYDDEAQALASFSSVPG